MLNERVDLALQVGHRVERAAADGLIGDQRDVGHRNDIGAAHSEAQLPFPEQRREVDFTPTFSGLCSDDRSSLLH